jgi:Protein of unknown function (DUF3365)
VVLYKGWEMFRRLRLGTQFNLLLTLIFLGGIILSGLTLSEAMQRKAEDEISTKAEILTQTMNAVRTYTSDHIAPLLQDQLKTTPTFVREVVPAFSAREVFENFRHQPEYQNFFYKEATLNPTNLKDKADEFETELVEQFRKQPNLDKLSGYRNLAGANQFFMARPLKVCSVIAAPQLLLQVRLPRLVRKMALVGRSMRSLQPRRFMCPPTRCLPRDTNIWC